MSQVVKQPIPKRVVYLSILALVLTTALCVAGVYYKDELMSIANMAGYSLLGVAIISFVAGSTVSITAIPVPYWLLVFTLPNILASEWGILAPIWVGLVSALGATLGHIPTFVLGYGGSRLSEALTTRINSRIYYKCIEWAKKHGSWASFVISAMLNPFHLPMTVAIGALRFSPYKWFIFSFLGNAVKGLFIAFGGYFGLQSLFRFLGG
ncbi:MAG: VTT domain-containing protein [Chloroflexi bacterium]|nr:VTT domain-containing protein [Chloroflexota bacterium]